MRTLSIFVLLLISAMFAESQTQVKFDLRDPSFRITQTTGRTVVVQAETKASSSGNVVLLPYTLRGVTGTNGSWTVSNIFGSSISGFYHVTIPAPPLRSDFDIWVQSTNLGLVSAASIRGTFGASTYPSSAFAWAADVSDQRYLSSTSTISGGVSTNYNFSNSVSNAGVISFTSPTNVNTGTNMGPAITAAEAYSDTGDAATLATAKTAMAATNAAGTNASLAAALAGDAVINTNLTFVAISATNSATAIGTNWIRCYNSGGTVLDGLFYHWSGVGSYTNAFGNAADYFTNVGGLWGYKNVAVTPNSVSNTIVGHYTGGAISPIDVAFALDGANIPVQSSQFVGTSGSNNMVAAWTAADAATLANGFAVNQTNVNLIFATNYGPALVTNFNTFFIANGAPATVVRSNYTLATTLSGQTYFTNWNAKVGVVSNAFTVGGLPAWTLQTNDGVLKTDTNTVLYFNTNIANGYPVGTWSKGTLAGNPAPTMSISSFLVTTNSAGTALPTIASPVVFQSPLTSNALFFQVETWGNDTNGRLAVYPFKSLDAVNFLSSNTNPYPIYVGAGWISNNAGNVSRSSFLNNQPIIGSGVDATIFGTSLPGAPAATFVIGNSNVVSGMTILGVIGAVTTSTSITNLTIRDCIMGNYTNFDNIYFGGTGILTDARITRVKFYTEFDSMNGVSTGVFTDCEWHCAGNTNDSIWNVGGGTVRPIYSQGSGAVVDNLTFINPKVFASVPSTNAAVVQGCVVIQSTNAIITIQNGYMWHQTNLIVINQVGGFNSHINADYNDVAVDVNSNFVSSCFVTVSNGIFYTNIIAGNISVGQITIGNGAVSGVSNLVTTNLTVTSALKVFGNQTNSALLDVLGNATFRSQVLIPNDVLVVNSGTVALDWSGPGYVRGSGEIAIASGYASGSLAAKAAVYFHTDQTVSFSKAVTATNGFVIGTNLQTMAQAAGGFTNGQTALVNISNVTYVGTMSANVATFTPFYATSQTENGTTNATALTSFTAVFSRNFPDTNYTAMAIGNGFALASSYVSAKTVSNCVFNMTIATGAIDWMAIKR